jgi:hypothetical protein
MAHVCTGPAVRLLAVLGSIVTLASSAPEAAPSAGSERAKGLAELGRLPDWSGMWLPDRPDQGRQESSNPPPWTADAARQARELAAQERAGDPKGLFIDCLPEAMPAWMLVNHNAMEILFTRGRVTMLGESDGNRLRRIYTDGRGHPPDPDLTFHGHSIGHWEGETLVVDTVGVLPQTYIAVSEAVGIPNNGDLHVVERIHLAGPDTLHDELEITAPHVLTRPWKTTRIFNRYKGPETDIVEGVCLQGAFAEKRDRDGNAIFAPLPHVKGIPVAPSVEQAR